MQLQLQAIRTRPLVQSCRRLPGAGHRVLSRRAAVRPELLMPDALIGFRFRIGRDGEANEQTSRSLTSFPPCSVLGLWLVIDARRPILPSSGAEPTRPEVQAGRPKQTCLLPVACTNVSRYSRIRIYYIYSVFFICFRYGGCQTSPHTCLRHYPQLRAKVMEPSQMQRSRRNKLKIG